MQTAIQFQQPLAPQPSPPRAVLKAPALVLAVWFTGVRRAGSRWRLLYDPPLDKALRTVLDDLATHPGNTGVMRAIAEREPPALRDSLVIVSAGEGQGRFPLAYITAAVGRLPVDGLIAAHKTIGGRS